MLFADKGLERRLNDLADRIEGDGEVGTLALPFLAGRALHLEAALFRIGQEAQVAQLFQSSGDGLNLAALPEVRVEARGDQLGMVAV